MTRTFPLFILVVVHLLALLALGGFVHGIQHLDGESTCPIPLAMGTDCSSVSDEGHSFAHMFSSIDYVISLLSVSLAPLFALIIVFVAYTCKRSACTRGEHAPPWAWERHVLSALVVRFQRFRRWMTIIRSDMPLIIAFELMYKRAFSYET
ncbi:MAG: hypothetical protein AAB855_05220 [Patescibacteria group bacterium]